MIDYKVVKDDIRYEITGITFSTKQEVTPKRPSITSTSAERPTDRELNDGKIFRDTSSSNNVNRDFQRDTYLVAQVTYKYKPADGMDDENGVAEIELKKKSARGEEGERILISSVVADDEGFLTSAKVNPFPKDESSQEEFLKSIVDQIKVTIERQIVSINVQAYEKSHKESYLSAIKTIPGLPVSRYNKVGLEDFL